VLEEGEGLWIDSDNIARPQEWERDRETETERVLPLEPSQGGTYGTLIFTSNLQNCKHKFWLSFQFNGTQLALLWLP
jgi:hypothetical protein